MTRKFDLGLISTTPLHGRPSLVFESMVGRPVSHRRTVTGLLNGMPRALAAHSLRRLAREIVAARRAGLHVIFGLGGHVVKSGCAPYITKMLEFGYVSAIAMPGSTAIHDSELLLSGRTSEDVSERLGKGAYGVTDDTGMLFARAALLSKECGCGLGAAVGMILNDRCGHLRQAKESLLATAQSYRAPATIHGAIGTDTIHVHPSFDAESYGRATHDDFLLFIETLKTAAVYVNVGSAVILPEVLLKAYTALANTEKLPEDGLFTANMDMLGHYRPQQNVLTRPARASVDLRGHHEIMLPLLFCALEAEQAGELEHDE